MDNFQRPDAFDPADYFRILRRRWWIVLGLTIIGLAAAAAYLVVTPKAYTATASVYVTAGAANANQVSGGRTSGVVNMDSEAQVVQSITVATIAARSLHTNVSPEQLLTNITVTVPANSQVLQIACTEPTAQDAANCAQAFAQAYLTNSTSTTITALKNQLTSLRGQVATLQRDVSNLTAKVASLPANSTARANTQAQLSSDQSQLSTLSHQEGAISAQMANSSSGSIITKAVPPSSPSSPQKKIILPSGLVAGLLLGLIAAFVVDGRDKRIRNRRDVERYLDLPVLLNVAVRQRNPQPMLVNPRSRPGQGFAELAHAMVATLGEGSHVLMIVGASSGPGCSFTAANLAVALSRMKPDVMLVSADLRGSVTPELFNLNRGRGLTDVLAGHASVQEVAERPVEAGRVLVMPPGSDTSVDLYNYQEDVTHRLAAELRASTSIVLIEAQAMGAGGDTLALAELADAALVVADLNRTTRPEVADVIERLERLRTPVLGAALVPALGNMPRSRMRAMAPPSVNPPAASGRGEIQRQAPRAGADSDAGPALPTTDMGETRPLPMASVNPKMDNARRDRPATALGERMNPDGASTGPDVGR